MKIMGIDLGIAKIAYAVWEDKDDEWVLVETDAYESQESMRQTQLMDIHDFIWEVAQNVKPDHVFIEDTLVGNNVKYSIQLSQTMGAVLVAMASRQLSDWFGVYTVNVSKWKATVIGTGRADKEKVKSYLYSRDSVYSVLCGDDQDRVDAACIGYYGCIISDRSESFA